MQVIDEIFRVLRLVQRGGTPPRAHEILQELRDISSMAMEHFDERIAPGLKLHMAPMKPGLGLAFLSQSCGDAGVARGSDMGKCTSLISPEAYTYTYTFGTVECVKLAMIFHAPACPDA